MARQFVEFLGLKPNWRGGEEIEAAGGPVHPAEGRGNGSSRPVGPREEERVC